jgi:hypothetical protein
VYVGSAGPECTAGEATLTLATKAAPAMPLATQTVMLSCADVTCSAQACLGWQPFELASPVMVSNGTWYQWRLDNLAPTGSIGVSPAFSRHGGPASLVVSPLYATKYAQYTFKTFMDTPPPANVMLGQAAAEVATGRSGGVLDAGSASTVTAGVLIPAAIIALVVLLIAGFVYIRRRSRKTVRAISSPVLPVAVKPAGAAVAAAAATKLPAMPTVARIRVSAANSVEGAAEEPEWCPEPGLDSRWAHRTARAAMGRRLPVLPASKASRGAVEDSITHDAAPLPHDALGTSAVEGSAC